MKNKETKLSLVRSERTLIVGIDVAKKKHWARMLDAQTGLEVGKAFSFHNSIEGFSWLLGKISRSKEEIGAQKVVVGMEPSGHYWKSLAWYITGIGNTVVTVNPYHVKKSKELDDNSPTKNDRKDAWIIATLVSQGRYFKYHSLDGIWAELRGYTQVRQQQKAKINAAKNNLVAILDEYFPEYIKVFVTLLGKASLYVLKNCPFPKELRQKTEEELTQELKKATNNRVGEKRAKNLLAAAKRSIGVPEGLSAAKMRLSQCIGEIEFLQKQITQTEEAMEKALEQTGLNKYLLSIPGVGIVTAATFLGEVGDISRYEDWRQLRKLAGYNLTENTSGEKQYGATKISKRGRPGLRCLLYQASLVLVCKNQQFKALYQHLKTRNDNPLKNKQALIVVSCKLLRVMFTLAKEKRLYDPEKVLGEYRNHQLKAVA